MTSPITLTLDTLVADVVRRYGYPADAARASLDAIRESLERVDEATYHPDHLEPEIAAEIILAYDEMPHDDGVDDDGNTIERPATDLPL